MEGNMPVVPGSTIFAGFHFTQPGNSTANTVGVNNASVSLTVVCPGSSTEQLVIPIPDQTYQVARSEWVPTNSQSDPRVWQGQVTVPETTCGGQPGRAPGGATFTADFHSTVPGIKTNVQFHYGLQMNASWSGTGTVIPTGAPHWQIDFASAPVIMNPPPKYGPNQISASTDEVVPTP
jgi:hypothetical protein